MIPSRPPDGPNSREPDTTSGEHQTARLISIQVGMPQRIAGDARGGADAEPWTSGILKHPVLGPVRVGRTNLDGDGQADLVHHGGPDKAVLAYCGDHYAAWRDELADARLGPGAFGENLTVTGVDETQVCIGDQWRVGEVVLEVSQPRQPCWKLGRRWNLPTLPKRVIATGRSGWYLRVIREGEIQAGMTLRLERRPHPEWTVAETAVARYHRQQDREAAERLAAMEELSGTWRSEFARRLTGGSATSPG